MGTWMMIDQNRQLIEKAGECLTIAQTVSATPAL
jgi:hypothetical protein